VYKISTGELVSVGTIIGSLSAGLAAVPISHEPNLENESWDVHLHVFVSRVARQIEIETGQVKVQYEIWLLWKNTRLEAIARFLPGILISEIQAKENAAWSAYKNILENWAAAI
jgi:hypothetical protein